MTPARLKHSATFKCVPPKAASRSASACSAFEIASVYLPASLSFVASSKAFWASRSRGSTPASWLAVADELAKLDRLTAMTGSVACLEDVQHSTANTIHGSMGRNVFLQSLVGVRVKSRLDLPIAQSGPH